MPKEVKIDTIVDPMSDNVVRFTENGLKDEDFYPDDQTPKPLFLNPAGVPYSMLNELDIPDDGEEEPVDHG